MKSTYLCLVFVVLLLLLSPVQAQDTQAIPFIYYYSQPQQAFIIERADGTDLSVLAQFQAGEGAFIGGAGWSPSGKWFSWNLAGSTAQTNVYVAGRNQGEKNILPSHNSNIRDAFWSPHDDLLLIRYAIAGRPVDSVIIYDPNTQKTVFQMLGEELHPDTLETQLAVSWSPDGSRLAILDYISKVIYLVQRPTWQIVKTLPAMGTGYTSNPELDSLPQWLDDTHLIYISPKEDQLFVENVITDTITKVQIPSGESVEQLIKSPDSLYALVYTRTIENNFNLWLFSSDEMNLLPIKKDVLFLPLMDVECSTRRSFWDENNLAFFFTKEDELYIFNAVDKSSELIAPGNIPCHRVLWTTQNTLMFTTYGTQSSSYQTYEYLPETKQLSSVHAESLTESDEVYIVELSSLGYRAYNQFIEDPTILKRYPIAMLSSNPKYGTLVVTDARWHPSKPWLFLVSWLINDLRLINVTNVDGSVQREIGLCPINSLTCYGWLPDVIDTKS